MAASATRGAMHPRLPQVEQRADNARRGVVTQSWSPLAKAGDLLREPMLVSIAGRHGKTPVQVVPRHPDPGAVSFVLSVRPSPRSWARGYGRRRGEPLAMARFAIGLGRFAHDPNAVRHILDEVVKLDGVGSVEGVRR